MRKRLSGVLAIVVAMTIAASGCGLTDNDTQQAEEFVSDDMAAEATSSEDTAVAETSLVVVDGLLEPALEEGSASASTSTVDSSDAAASASTTEVVEEPEQTVIVCMGDSQLANGRSDATDIGTLASQRIPDSIVYNIAIGGTTASVEESTSDYQPGDLKSTCFLGMAYALAGLSDRNAVLADHPNVLETMNKIDPAKVDYYLIEYGTNDFFNVVPLDHTQTSADQVYTYYDAMTMAISTLKSISPDAKFVIMTPFYGVYKDDDGALIGDSYVVSNGYGTLSNYAEKAINVAEDEKTLDFDAMFGSLCDLYIDTADQYLIDGVHLTLTGRQIFARLLAHVINVDLGYEPYAYKEHDYINISSFNPEEDYRYRDDMLKEYYPEYYEKLMNGEYRCAQPLTEETAQETTEEAATASTTATE